MLGVWYCVVMGSELIFYLFEWFNVFNVYVWIMWFVG